MDKQITQLLKDHNLVLKYADIDGPGYLIPTLNNDPDWIVVPNSATSQQVENVILHEIGHLENDDSCINYKDDYRVRIGSEHNANSFMIREKVKEYVALGNDILSSNYVDLANTIGTTDYIKVKAELSKYLLNN